MKCRYCGGEVGLEENFCPYCGRPNEQAQGHHRDMASFRRRYAETEASVVNKAEHYSRIIPRVILILVLLFAAVGMWIVSVGAWRYPEAMRSRAALRDPEATKAVLDGYLAEGDYLSFASYMEFNDIQTYDTPFAEYSDVRWCATYYQTFVIDMERILLQRDRESWQHYSASSDIRFLCSTLDSFTDTYARAMEDDEPSAFHRACMEDMRANILDMLHVYMNIRPEESDAFLALSENQKAARIEEVLLGA